MVLWYSDLKSGKRIQLTFLYVHNLDSAKHLAEIGSRVQSELHNMKPQTSAPAKNMNDHYQCYTDTADDCVTHCQLLLQRIYSPQQADSCLSVCLSLFHPTFHSLCEPDGNCLNKEGSST